MAHIITEAWVPVTPLKNAKSEWYVSEPFMVPSGPPLLPQPENQRRWPLDPWFDYPATNAGWGAPWSPWVDISNVLAMGLWIFVIIMVLFAIIFGGPRY